MVAVEKFNHEQSDNKGEVAELLLLFTCHSKPLPPYHEETRRRIDATMGGLRCEQKWRVSSFRTIVAAIFLLITKLLTAQMGEEAMGSNGNRHKIHGVFAADGNAFRSYNNQMDLQSMTPQCQTGNCFMCSCVGKSEERDNV